MSQDIFQRVNEVALQLKAEGKAVSLALVRSRLPGVDPARLFSAFQAWRSTASKNQEGAPLTPAPTLIAQDPLKQQLDRIEQKLDRLLQLMESR